MKNDISNWQSLILLIGLFFILLVINSFTHHLAKLHTLEEQRGQLAAQATQAIQTQQALETAIAYNQTDAAVDEWAHAHGMTQAGEYPVVPQALSTPPATPTPSASPTPSLSNWQAWWAIFFNDH